MADSLSERAPKGLSASARRRWVEQVAALDAAGRATPARLELVSNWAAALDAAGHARAVWEEAGSPESELGSQGQARRHHLAAGVERADALVANLAGKVERAGSRRVPRQPAIPSGARVIERRGSYVVVLVDGKLLTRSVSTGEWVAYPDERDAADGVALRWMGTDGVPVFHDPPPSYASGPPPREVCVAWAEAKGIPKQAVLDWLAHPSPRSKIVAREDVDLLAFTRRG